MAINILHFINCFIPKIVILFRFSEMKVLNISEFAGAV